MGGLGRLIGRSLAAALMAAWTSRAARSTFRFRSNCRVTLVPPSVLTEVISDTPAICPSRRSNGAANEDATVAGSAPGSDAETEITRKSTRGIAATGKERDATTPNMNKPAARSEVATGLLMKGPDILVYRAPARSDPGGISAAPGEGAAVRQCLIHAPNRSMYK